MAPGPGDPRRTGAGPLPAPSCTPPGDVENRIHSSLLAFGKPCPVSDLFGKSGRELLGRLELPDPWTKNIATALSMIDDLDSEIDACEKELRSLGADHPYVSLLQSAPGIAWVLGFTIRSEERRVGK